MTSVTQQHKYAGFAIEQLADGHDEAWDRFVVSHPRGSIYHLAVWGNLITRLFGHQTYYLCAKHEGTVVGILPLVRLKSRFFGDFLVSMPYFNYGGAIALETQIEEALMVAASELAGELGCAYIEFRDAAPRSGSWPVRTNKVIMELELPESKELLWSSFGSKVRAQVKRPAKEKVQTVFGGAELLDDFYYVFSYNMRDLGTPVYPKRFFELIQETFPQSASLIILHHTQRPAAAAFTLGFKGRFEVPWASSIAKYNRFGVNMLLYWKALEQAVERDYRLFDFGRSSTDSGTYRFKKQWGAQPKQLYWHYWLNEGTELPNLTPSNPKYNLAIKAWQRLPLSLTHWLGPKIVKNLP